MKQFLILSLLLLSQYSFAEKEFIGDVKKKSIPKNFKKAPEVPCKETAEEILKKLEEKKKEEASKGLGLSLQGAKTGCSVK